MTYATTEYKINLAITSSDKIDIVGEQNEIIQGILEIIRQLLISDKLTVKGIIVMNVQVQNITLKKYFKISGGN